MQWIFLLAHVDYSLIVCKYGERIKEVAEALRRKWIVNNGDGFYNTSQDYFFRKIVCNTFRTGGSKVLYPMDVNYSSLGSTVRSSSHPDIAACVGILSLCT